MGFWDPQKMVAFDLYLKGKKVREIVQDVTVSEQTIRKWMKHPKWTQLESHHNEEVLRQLRAREVEASSSALDTVIRIMEKGTSRDRTKLAAAKLILDRAAPVIKTSSEDGDGSGQGVKVIVVNNGSPQLNNPARLKELKEFEEEMGYSSVIPPKLVAGPAIEGEVIELPNED